MRDAVQERRGYMDPGEMMSCPVGKKHGHRGHTWKGHGPNRICEKCDLHITHASEGYPKGQERYLKSMEDFHKAPRGQRRTWARNFQDEVRYRANERLEREKYAVMQKNIDMQKDQATRADQHIK